MLAESIHSFADCGNQVLLYLGSAAGTAAARRRCIRSASASITYFWSFIVALMLFSVGGLFSIQEGWHKLHEPDRSQQAWVALLVLGVSIVLEFGSTLGCLREIRKLRGERTLRHWVETTRNAELVVVLGEDLAALVGLVLAFIFVSLAAATGNLAVRRHRLHGHRRGADHRVDLHRDAHQGPDRRALGRRRPAGGARQSTSTPPTASRSCTTQSRCRWARRSCWPSRCA